MMVSSLASFFRRAGSRIAPAKPQLTPSIADWVRHHAVGEILPVKQEQQIALPLPYHKGDLDPAFTGGDNILFPKRYLAVLPGITLRGRDGFVVLPDGSYATETADPAWLRPHPAYWQRFQARPRRIKGPCLSLLGLHCREHYHWIADALARLHRVLPHLPGDCRFVVPDGLREDQLELLFMLGVSRESLIVFDAGEPLSFDEFWFASPAAPDRFDDPEAVGWLRSMLWPEDRSRTELGTSRLFISRANAATRRLVNETELEPVLRQFGFDVIQPETMSLREQAKIFSGAEVILGGHGAGFTNIVFCREGAKLIELFPEQVSFRTYYWSLASACGVDYFYLPGRTPTGKNLDHGDFEIDRRALHKFLQKTVGLSTPGGKNL